MTRQNPPLQDFSSQEIFDNIWVYEKRYAYVYLLINIKQQDLTDNNLLNWIRFGQVNEKYRTRIVSKVIGRNVDLEM